MKSKYIPLRVLTISGIFMALVILFSSFGVPVPGGKMYLNDAVITLAAFLLPPLPALLVGGLGAFLGDFIFYPTPMFVSLCVHGFQALMISLLLTKKRDHAYILCGLLISILINVVGYSLGRAFIYATVDTALLKLPYQILQATVGSVLAYIIYEKTSIKHLYQSLTHQS